MTLFNFGSDNPLIQRVRRHRSMSTLFRRVSHAPEPRPVSSDVTDLASVELGAPLETVQAELVSAQRAIVSETPESPTAQPAPDLPSQAAPALLTQPDRGQAETSRPNSESTLVSPVAAASPSQPVSESNRRTMEASDEPAPQEQVRSTDEEASAITETVWQRLRTIFQRHQESEGEPPIQPGREAASESSGPDSVGTDRNANQERNAQLGTGISETPEEPPDAPSKSGEPVTVQRQEVGDIQNADPIDTETESKTAGQPQSEPSVGETAAIEIQRQTDPEFSPADTELEDRTASQRLPTESAEFEATVEKTESATHPATKTEATQASGPSDSEQISSLKDEETDRVVATSEPTPELESLPDVTAARDDTTSAVGLRLERPPLQEVWDVQTKERRQVPKPSVPTVSKRTSPTETGITPQVQQVMRQATPDRPTRSSIEVIQPRRPRPSTPPVERPRVSRDPVTDTRASREVDQGTASRRPIQSERAEPQHEGGKAMRSLDVEATNGTRENESLETQTVSSPSGEDPPVMVETEIGPLPGDLWQLIGEPVPVRREHSDSQPTRREEATETQHQNADGKRAAPIAQVHQTVEAHVQSSPMSGTPDPVGEAATVAQRVESSTIETSETQPETEETSEEGVDIDELARRVYGEVRRRLAVELERMRTYF